MYGRWMREHLQDDLPRESVATCETCVMVPPRSGPRVTSATYFDPVTKCCTFLPELHNFLAGQILGADDVAPEARASVDRRIQAGVAVTPLGLGRRRSYMLLYDNGGDLVFGRASGLRCPHHLDDGRCGVWKYRESTCATWFCKHVRGKVGSEIWRATHQLLRLAERDLSWWCVRELGVDVRALATLLARRRNAKVTATEIDQQADPDSAERRALWGAWTGREVELYRACAAKVEALSWSEVLAVGSPELRAAADITTAVVADSRRTDLPARITTTPFTIMALRGETATITTYNSYDPLTLPLGLLEVLEAFDGRPTEDVMADLEARGIELDPDLLRRLLDFGVLEHSAPGHGR